jgi:hypothetical protein
VGATVAVLGELDAADARQGLDGGRDRDDEQPHLTGQVVGDVGQVAVDEGTEGETDRKPGRRVEVQTPAVVAPQQPLLGDGVWRPGAPAVCRVLPAARRLGVGQRLERLHPERVELERVDVPPRHLLHGHLEAAVGTGRGQDARVELLGRLRLHPFIQPARTPHRLVPNRTFRPRMLRLGTKPHP